MEIIIVLAAITVVALAWAVGKSKDKEPIDNWEPPKEMHLTDKEWPYGEKLSEGKIHVKTSDVAPTGSENRVEAPAPVVTNSNPADNVPVVETKPTKKAPAKKTAAKPAAAKKAPAKKKSV